MAIFNSYVSLPEGILCISYIWIINHLLESTSLDLPRAAQEKHIAVAKLLIEVETQDEPTQLTLVTLW
jgi:hypothetical protein